MDADQTIDRIHDRAADLIVALTARDTAAAYQAARQLRTCCDVVITDLLPEYMVTAAELSEVAHD